jgi:dihydroorotase-like cyclic amidohydrolase
MFTDDGVCVTDSTTMKLAFDYTSIDNLLISQHCEDHSLTNHFAMNESKVSFNLD